jgi:putative ABC transport system permease protein
MFRPKRSVDDFNAEIAAHLQLERECLQAEGCDAETARDAAHRRFGNVTLASERFHESGRWLWWDLLVQDIRYAARMLRSAPGFAAIAVTTMALGIGATTAIFSVVDATLLHPLPYPDPDQLVAVEADLPGVGARDAGLSQPEWQDLQRSGVFTDVSPVWFDENNLTGSSRPTRVSLVSVAPNYFAVLGVRPQLGRTFNPSEHGPGFLLEVVISDGLWQRAFGADPNVLGRSIRLDTDLYRIIGVMGPDFRAPGRTPAERDVEVWAGYNFYGAPLPDHPARNARFLPQAIARVKPGLTLAAAQHRVDALADALRKAFPGDYPAESAWRLRLVPLRDTVVGDVRQSLILLLGAVGLVLLIGCVNIASLLLARAGARGREIAVRQAIGAGRSRLTRQLLTESVLLSVVGGLAGVLLLFAAREFLLRLVPDGLPRLNAIAINWTVLVFALAASVVTGVIFGIVPALQSGRLDVMRMLKQEGRGSTASSGQARTRRALVVAEFALSLVLMVAAGLLLRSFRDLANVGLGFNPHAVMAVRTRLPYPNDPKADRYATAAQETPFFREILRRVRTLDGVEEAAAGNSTAIPLDHTQRDLNTSRLFVEGRETRGNDAPFIANSIVSPEYFHLLGIALQRGRAFTQFDDGRAPRVAVVNEAAGRTYWPNQDPIGKRVRLSRSQPTDQWTTIVGVVADARTESLADDRVPQIYTSLYQTTAKHAAIFLRGKLDAAAIPDQVRAQVHAVDDTLPVFGAERLTDTVSSSLAARRFALEMVGLFAVAALALAAIGIYGVIAYIVSERTHEIGIRLALGAQRRAILRGIVGQGLRLTIVGTAVGLVCALGVARAMAGLLYGVGPADPPTFATVAVLLVGVAFLGSYIPARRALRVDPLIALRRH